METPVSICRVSMGEAKDQPAVFRYIAAGKVTPGPKFDAVSDVFFFPFFPGNFIHQVVENLAKKNEICQIL
jgi:hypothetical protein